MSVEKERLTAYVLDEVEATERAAIEAALSVAAQKAIAWLQSRDPAQPALTALESVDFTQGVYWLALAELAPRFPRYFAKRPDGADFGELEGARRHYETEARGCLARIAGFAAPPVIGCHQLGPKE